MNRLVSIFIISSFVILFVSCFEKKKKNPVHELYWPFYKSKEVLVDTVAERTEFVFDKNDKLTSEERKALIQYLKKQEEKYFITTDSLILINYSRFSTPYQVYALQDDIKKILQSGKNTTKK